MPTDVTESPEWDTRQERIQAIGSLSNAVREAQLTAHRNPTQQNLAQYQSLLRTLYMDIRIYFDSDVELDEQDIDQDLKNARNRIRNADENIQAFDILETLMDIDWDLSEARKQAGLDIPVNERIEFGQS